MPAPVEETREQLLARLEKARGIFRDMKAKELRDQQEFQRERDGRLHAERVLAFVTAIVNGDQPPPNQPDHPLIALVEECATEAAGRIHPSVWAARRLDLIRRIDKLWGKVIVGPGLAPDTAAEWQGLLREVKAEIDLDETEAKYLNPL